MLVREWNQGGGAFVVYPVVNAIRFALRCLLGREPDRKVTRVLGGARVLARHCLACLCRDDGPQEPDVAG